MSFLTPLAGLIAAAIAIPALLLLYFLKLRRRTEVVPSTVLWRKAIQDLQVNAPFQRLRRNLLLLLQLLILAALVLALAQPNVPFRPTPGKSTVLLIDRSASMSASDGDDSGGTRLDEAKRRARSLVGALPPGGQAMVIAFDDRAEIVQGFTSDSQVLRRAIDSITPTDRPTRLKLAYQLADAQGSLLGRAVADANTIAPPDVHLYSDGNVTDAADVSIRSEVRYEPIGSDKSRNIGIVSLSARRNFERPSEVQVFARVSNSGPSPVETDLQLTVNGQVAKVARVSAIPERWDENQRREADRNGVVVKDAAEFTLDMPQAGVIRVEQMNTEGDALKTDDAASLIIPPPRRLSIVLVAPEGGYFLPRLLRSMRPREFKEITPAAYEAQPPTDADILVFEGHRPRKLPDGGGCFIYFGSIAPGLRLTAATADNSPDGVLLQRSEPVAVADFKRDHPIFRNIGSLTKLYATKTIELRPASESEVLIDSTSGPMLVLHRERRSIHLAFSFEFLDSTAHADRAFPVIMQQLIQFLASASDLGVRETYSPGTAPRIPRPALGNSTSLTLTGPQTNTQLSLPPEGDIALPGLERVGLYRLTPPPTGFEQLAVNLLDPAESNLTPAKSAPGGIGQTIETTRTQARLELWWWLLLALALPVLLVEWVVYTRRAHL
jgi:hypothetical protein